MPGRGGLRGWVRPALGAEEPRGGAVRAESRAVPGGLASLAASCGAGAAGRTGPGRLQGGGGLAEMWEGGAGGQLQGPW